MMRGKSFKTIDEYIAAFPKEVQGILKTLRREIKKSAPKAAEAISYGIPTFKLNGNLVHFVAFKKHIGFYPTPSAIVAFKKELSRYKTSKGAIQFPIEEPMPLPLIGRMVKFRVNENLGKEK
jgi:uncharacterized protein YdhG (YjbR/CyaY superfamily)